MNIRPATESDISAITAIYNDVIATSNAVYRNATVDETERLSWFRQRISDGFPIIVVEESGQVIAYGLYGPFRAFEGYAHTVEHTIHVDANHRGRGLGKALLTELIELARKDGRHVMVGGIDSENIASIELHKNFGFSETARMPEIAKKNGQLLTLVLMQKILN